MRIFLEIVQFKLRSMNVIPDRTFAIQRAGTLAVNILPGRGSPEIRGKRIGQTVGNVPNQLVLASADHAHRVVHGNFVERVRGGHLIPALGINLLQSRQKGPSMHLGSLQRTSKVENGGSQVSQIDHGVAITITVLDIRRMDNKRDPHPSLVQSGFTAGKRNPMIRRIDDQCLIINTRLLENFNQSSQALINTRNALVILG